jgi:hypothetical protein
MTLLCIVDPDREIHYQSILEDPLSEAWTVFYAECLEDVTRADICLVSDEYNSRAVSKALYAKRLGIPILHIVDGICEWRNIWENPRSQDPSIGMPLFQPMLADKVACLGPFQARLLESWGAYGKCEILGSPRLDVVLAEGRKRTSIQECERSKRRITVATARSAGFNTDQILMAKQSLEDINEWIRSQCPDLGSQVVWRPGDPAFLPHDPIGRVSLMNEETALEVLKSTDAFITTPSTIALEAMAMGIPTCVVDYTNSPRFLNAAWYISAFAHIGQELTSLLKPSERRMQFQRFLLHDQLRCDDFAAPRVAKLIVDMIDHARKSRENASTLAFPTLMVDQAQGVKNFSYPYRPDLLFPAHQVFQREDADVVKAENGHLYLAVSALESELRRVRSKASLVEFIKRTIRYSIRRAGRVS